MLSCAITSSSFLLYLSRLGAWDSHSTPKCSVSTGLATRVGKYIPYLFAKTCLWEQQQKECKCSNPFTSSLSLSERNRAKIEGLFFFLTEIGRPQCLINLCFWVSVIANNVGCNIASVCYCGFFLSLVSYITPLTPSFGISFFVLKTFPSVHFLQTFRDNSQTTSHHQTMSTNHHHGFTKAMKLLATSMLQCRLVITIRENLHK